MLGTETTMRDTPAQSNTEPETDEQPVNTPTCVYWNDYDTAIGERWRRNIDPETHG